MGRFDFRVTPQFSAAYDALDDDSADVVDAVILRLCEEHDSAWARANRVVGESGDAWMIETRIGDGYAVVYWQYYGDELILLLILALRP
jgi:hypothetical protein